MDTRIFTKLTFLLLFFQIAADEEILTNDERAWPGQGCTGTPNCNKYNIIASELKNENAMIANAINSMKQEMVMKIDSVQSRINNAEYKLLNKIREQLCPGCKDNSTRPPITQTIPTFSTRPPFPPTPPQSIQWKNCYEALRLYGSNGVYTLNPTGNKPFEAYCLRHTDNTIWAVIQRRQDGSVNFDRNWHDYQMGFGHPSGEFFLGLDNIYALTLLHRYTLWIELHDWDGEKKFVKYSDFKIGGPHQSFNLTSLGNFTGSTKDSFREHLGMKFTTNDVDNDLYHKVNCAKRYKGGWWYKNCAFCSLNSPYYVKGKHIFKYGITWVGWRGNEYSLKYVQMAIKIN